MARLEDCTREGDKRIVEIIQDATYNMPYRCILQQDANDATSSGSFRAGSPLLKPAYFSLLVQRTDCQL